MRHSNGKNRTDSLMYRESMFLRHIGLAAEQSYRPYLIGEITKDRPVCKY